MLSVVIGAFVVVALPLLLLWLSRSTIRPFRTKDEASRLSLLPFPSSSALDIAQRPRMRISGVCLADEFEAPDHFEPGVPGELQTSC